MKRRFLLIEDFMGDDIIELSMRLRVKISRENKLLDILTKIRGIEHVVTATQSGLLEKAPDKRRMLNMNLKYENSMKDFSVDDLIEQIKQIEGVDMVRVVSGDTSAQSAMANQPDVVEPTPDEEISVSPQPKSSSSKEDLSPAERLIKDLVSEMLRRSSDIV